VKTKKYINESGMLILHDCLMHNNLILTQVNDDVTEIHSLSICIDY